MNAFVTFVFLGKKKDVKGNYENAKS